VIRLSLGVEHLFESVSEPLGTVPDVKTRGGTHMTTPWADVVTLGEARFGHLEGGPFDGRCYPLLDGTPPMLDVPLERHAGATSTLRYVLRDGRYRYAEIEHPASAA
jgi:hypothetical protein